LSGNDLTSAEFTDAVKADKKFKKMVKQRFSIFNLDGADHTFSQQVWREQVAKWTTEWIKKR
jgi:hypothetical protein